MLAELTLIDQSIQRRLAFYSFWEFCLWYDERLFTRRPFLRTIAEAFQQVYDNYINGKVVTVSVSMPPRAGKSYITSLFCSWWLAKLPELCVMRNSCTADLYMDFSYDVRNIIKSDIYKNTFQYIQLCPDRQNITSWSLTTSLKKAYFGSGVGGNIIGSGANLAISDDLYTGIDDAISPTYNKKVKRWKQGSHDSRKELNCPEIYIGTRWSINDVIGEAIETGKIDIMVVIPALDENDKSFCEDVNTTNYYLELRDGKDKTPPIDKTIWMAQYMQQPIENEGLLFPISELKFFNITEIKKENIEYVLIVIDPADQGGDNYAALQCLVIGSHIFITDVIFNNYGTDINIGESVELAVNSKATAISIENNAGWGLAGKEIRRSLTNRLPDCDVRFVKAIKNKATRILNNSAWIKHNVYFREDYKANKEYNAFMNNVTSYLREGGNKHDDGPDALTMIAQYCDSNLSHLW